MSKTSLNLKDFLGTLKAKDYEAFKKVIEDPGFTNDEKLIDLHVQVVR